VTLLLLQLACGFAGPLYLAIPLLGLLQRLESTQQEQLLQPEQLLRMLHTAMHHQHKKALQMICGLKTCDGIQLQQLAGLIADAMRTRSHQAAREMLSISKAVMLCSTDVEQLLLLAIAGMHPSLSGLVGHNVCIRASIALKLSQLPGLAQLSVEQLAVVLRAAIQCQAALLREMLQRDRWVGKDGEKQEKPAPATQLDAILEALCKAGQLDGTASGVGIRSSSSSSRKFSDELNGSSKPRAAILQDLLGLALQQQNWHAVQTLCRCKLAEELSVDAAVALLQQQPASTGMYGAVQGARFGAMRAAIASALCSVPAVRALGCEQLAAVLQHLVQDGSGCSKLLEGLCQLPVAQQLGRGVVDGLVAAAGASGSRGVLKAFAALQGV
jgi:hypothetical protein